MVDAGCHCILAVVGVAVGSATAKMQWHPEADTHDHGCLYPPSHIGTQSRGIRPNAILSSMT